jgi:endonuclease/exonuclease/phosphatase family metal-dependent hydrolase
MNIQRFLPFAGVPAVLVSMVVLAAPSARAQWLRTVHDGFTTDWEGWPVLATDAAGDANPDLIQMQASRDESSVTFRLATGSELLLQEDFPIRLILDTDSNPATGTPVEGLGAELVWTFSSKSGSYRYGTGTTITVRHDDLALRALPAWSATDFEIRLDLDARPDGTHLLFPAETARVVISHAGGDRLPSTGHATVDLGAGSLATFAPTPLPRPGDGSLRLAAWNVLFGKIFDTNAAVTAAYDRILTVLAPDVISFEEIWDQSAAQLVTRLNQLVPEQGPWTAVKLDAGNIIAARFPIRQSWLVQSGYRESAALVDVSAVLGDSLLFIANHLRCCSANAERQDEADGLIQFLHNARNPGGAITLRPGTPMVLVGDFNLVGDSQQYTTLMTGDIVDNAGYGPDSPPDWDGSALADLVPLFPDSPEAATWWDNGSTYSPGRLDLILYTDSVLEALRGGVVATPFLAPELLGAWGLQAGDAWTASDHFAVWGDFRLTVAQPEPPQLGIQRLGDGSLRLDWPVVQGATGYRVEQAQALGGAWFEAGQTSALSWPLAAPVGGQAALLRVVALP